MDPRELEVGQRKTRERSSTMSLIKRERDAMHVLNLERDYRAYKP